MQADAAAASPAAAPAGAASQAEGGRLQELQALLERQNTEIEKLTKELEAVKVGDVGGVGLVRGCGSVCVHACVLWL